MDEPVWGPEPATKMQDLALTIGKGVAFGAVLIGVSVFVMQSRVSRVEGSTRSAQIEWEERRAIIQKASEDAES